jgi:hypothetical protein
MSHDLPDRLALARRSGGALEAFEAEIVAEKASSLGHHGRQVEKAIAALRAFDADSRDAGERTALIDRAAYAVWAFLVQRELCGLRDQKQVVKDYDVPNEVLARLGAVKR